MAPGTNFIEGNFSRDWGGEFGVGGGRENDLGSDSKASAYNTEARFDPWVGKILGEGNSNPLQYSCLENPMDEGVW